MSVIHIPAIPRGRIDVFTLDMGRAEATAFVAHHPGTDDPARAWPLRAALGLLARNQHASREGGGS